MLGNLSDVDLRLLAVELGIVQRETPTATA